MDQNTNKDGSEKSADESISSGEESLKVAKLGVRVAIVGVIVAIVGVIFPILFAIYDAAKAVRIVDFIFSLLVGVYLLGFLVYVLVKIKKLISPEKLKIFFVKHWFWIIVWVVAFLLIIIMFCIIKVKKINDFDVVQTPTEQTGSDAEILQTTTVPPTITLTPTPTLTPSLTATATSSPTPTPSPTKALELGCIPAYWDVFPANNNSLKTVDLDGCSRFTGLMISGINDGVKICCEPDYKTYSWGITRPIDSVPFRIGFTIRLNKFDVSDVDEKSRIFFGFVRPGQTSIDYNDNLFSLYKKGGGGYKNSLYFEDTPIFYFKILDKYQAESEPNNDVVGEDKYEVIISIDVDESFELKYSAKYMGETVYSDSLQYPGSYSDFVIGYDFDESTNVNIEIIDFEFIEY